VLGALPASAPAAVGTHQSPEIEGGEMGEGEREERGAEGIG